MKSLIFLIAIFSFLNCHNHNVNTNFNKINESSSSVVEMKEMKPSDGKYADIEYAFKIQTENNLVKIKYRLTNKGKEDFLVFNRGDSQKGYQEGLVYAEPKTETFFELSQKMFQEPQNSGCPDRIAPIRAGASWVKAGQSIEENIQFQLPAKLFTPFDDCTRLQQFTGKEQNFKFCLGISKADSKIVSVNEQGVVQNWKNVDSQQLLCSAEMKLEKN